jgi:hypothetical protein
MAGRFFFTVVTRVVTSADALALHSRDATGGVHFAVTSALLWQLALQLAVAMQLGGVILPSHFGALYVAEQPPLQFTLAPHMTIALASSLQLPVHVPEHEPSQCAGVPGVYTHAASHLPLQVPMHDALLTIIPVPPIAVHVPVQFPMHVQWQLMLGAVPGVQVPEQSAWHEPWQFAAAVTVPSQVALALHVASHSPVISPGSQLAVMSGGVQFALPLHDP